MRRLLVPLFEIAKQHHIAAIHEQLEYIKEFRKQDLPKLKPSIDKFEAGLLKSLDQIEHHEK